MTKPHRFRAHLPVSVAKNTGRLPLNPEKTASPAARQNDDMALLGLQYLGCLKYNYVANTFPYSVIPVERKSACILWPLFLHYDLLPGSWMKRALGLSGKL